MEHFIFYRTDVALLLARLVLGTLFFLQGYDKTFRLGLRRTGDGVAKALHDAPLPASLTHVIAAGSSLVELLCGALLIAGWLIYPSLYLLGFDLLLVVFAMSLRESLWDMRFVWSRLILLLLLLLLPDAAGRFSLDHLLR